MTNLSEQKKINNRKMKVLVACEYSGRVRDAFIKRGHDAMSCDLLPTTSSGPHYQGDVRDIFHEQWDLLIAHPPCTYLCSSGLHWNTRRPERKILTEQAVEFARIFIDGTETQHIPLKAVENPIGCLSKLVRPPDQIIQPNWFGDDASKSTCLWLQGLLPLKPTQPCYPRLVFNNGKWAMRWANQTDSGQNNLPPSDDRWALRSETYPGIADAMAEQWGLYE